MYTFTLNIRWLFCYNLKCSYFSKTFFSSKTYYDPQILLLWLLWSIVYLKVKINSLNVFVFNFLQGKVDLQKNVLLKKPLNFHHHKLTCKGEKKREIEQSEWVKGNRDKTGREKELLFFWRERKKILWRDIIFVSFRENIFSFWSIHVPVFSQANRHTATLVLLLMFVKQAKNCWLWWWWWWYVICNVVFMLICVVVVVAEMMSCFIFIVVIWRLNEKTYYV